MVSAPITTLNSCSKALRCLNPYYTGRWFLLNKTFFGQNKRPFSLNPYYTGRWFLLADGMYAGFITTSVLILIILEDGFCYFLYMQRMFWIYVS